MALQPTRRVVLVAALVTLLALFLTFYSTASAKPLSGTIAGTVPAQHDSGWYPGTVPGVLDTCGVFPDAVTLNGGETQRYEYFARDPDDNDITDLVTVTWAVTGAGQLSIRTGSVVFFAASLKGGTSATVQATGTQGPLTCSPNAATIVVVAPTATPIPTPIPTVIVPDEDVAQITPPTDGSAATIQPNATSQLTSPGGDVTIDVPKVATAKTSQLEYKPVAPQDAPAPPTGFAHSLAFELNLYDDQGVLQSNVSLHNPLDITIKLTPAQIASVNGDLSRFAFFHLKGGAWIHLLTMVEFPDVLTAKVFSLSTFSVGAAEERVTPTATTSSVILTPLTTPPIVGGTAPNSSFLVVLLVVAIVFIASGTYYLRQTGRRSTQ